MFANSYQSGFISIFYSVGSNPLSLWDKQVKNGHIRRIIDDEVKSLVLEISGTNVATTYITCPIKPRASLGIKLPFLVMVIKNMKKYFTFEIQILDDKDMHRRFRVSNFQSTTKVRPFCTTMPIGLSSGWNQVQFNLADFTKRAYGSTYLETMRVQIHANVRVRRIYFTDTLYSDEDMPNEFKLFAPTTQKKKQVDEKTSKDTKEQPHLTTPKTVQGEDMPPPPSPMEEEAKLPSSPVEPAAEMEVEVEPPAAEPAETEVTPKPEPAEGAEPAPAETHDAPDEKDDKKEEVEEDPEGKATPSEDHPEGELPKTEPDEEGEPGPHGEHHAEKPPESESEAAKTEETGEVPTDVADVSTTEQTTAEPVPTTEPASTEEPAMTEEPATTEEPTTTEEPATTDEPATTEPPTESENESPEE